MDERVRLRVSARSVVVAVAVVVLTLAAVRVAAAAGRVLGWVVVATIVAGLLHPLVVGLSRRVPRAVALLVVIFGVLGVVGWLIWGSVDDLQTQADRLREAAPEAAQRIEDSERFGEAATEFELTERVTDFVDSIPERLRGGDAATALRSAATRGVAYLATSVLTLFLILHGPKLVAAGLRQIRDDDRRARVTDVLRHAYVRAWRYVVYTLGRAFLAGGFTFVVCKQVDVPGSFLLAVWVAAFSLVPLLGVLVGSLAVVMLSFAVDPDSTAWVATVFIAYQVFEVLVIQRRIERSSLHVGPVVTLAAAMLGLEGYGIGGMLALVAFAVLAVAIARDVAPGASPARAPAEPLVGAG